MAKDAVSVLRAPTGWGGIRAAKGAKRGLFYLLLACIAIVALFPFVWLLLTSFKIPVEILSKTPTFLPKNFTLENYGFFFTGYDPRRGLRIPIQREFINSIIIALCASGISVLAGTCAGYAVARRRKKWMMVVFMVILAMRTIPRVSIAIPLYLFIQRLGLLNTLAGVTLAHITIVLPLSMFMMYSFLSDIPITLEEATTVDGANRFQAFWYIILPLAAPGLAVTMILAFIFSYNDFLYALILVSTQEAMTLPLGLSQFILQYGIAWELMSAIGTMATVPVIVLTFFVQKHIVQGLTMGAVKG